MLTDPALQRLLDQNHKWADDFEREHPGFFKKSAEHQHPKVLWLGCSDSRVPESVITAAFPGEIFVQRNIGNQCILIDDNFLSVLEYALSEHVGVEHVVITGHTNCGACQAALDAIHTPCPKPIPEPPTSLDRWLIPLINLARTLPPDEATVNVLVRKNIWQQVENMANSNPVQRNWRNGGNVSIHGWIYQLDNGYLTELFEIRKGDKIGGEA
ncbi:unnamed protein product [Somion occarium]|uniref:Carbonic anhydrase n=1 Tax=Somion occarium TaxID=3059160 RepID=A0ABP1CVC6_9APHY